MNPRYRVPRTDILSLDEACLLLLRSVILRARLDAGEHFFSASSMDTCGVRPRIRSEAEAFLENFLSEADV